MKRNIAKSNRTLTSESEVSIKISPMNIINPKVITNKPYMQLSIVVKVPLKYNKSN